MVDLRKVKRPAALKATPATDDQVAEMMGGEMHAIGIGPAGELARQLDIYHRDHMTLALPIDGPAALKPWIFNGYIDPFDCRTHYLANHSTLQGE